MINPNFPLQFERVAAQLEQWRETVKDDLRAPGKHEDALESKRQLDRAIACLEFCQRHQIWPNSQVTELPPMKTMWSEYRIVEDHESENREFWTEIEVDGREFRPGEGDLILSRTF